MRSLITFVLVACGLYAGFGALLYLLQNRMVFLANMPGRELAASPADIGLHYEDVWVDTDDGERLHGWYLPRREARGILLFFHGNAGNISHRLESMAIFHRLALEVLILDYRGYGQSTGKPSESGTYRDARSAWDYLVETRNIAPERIVVFGRSLGGAVGAWLASRPGIRPGAVIIESSFTSGMDMARRLYPLFPARLLTRLRYPVAEYVAAIEAPVMVVHSREDEIIPFEMGRAIYDAANEPKSFLELRGDHNAGFWISREEYARRLDAFLERALNGA